VVHVLGDFWGNQSKGKGYDQGNSMARGQYAGVAFRESASLKIFRGKQWPVHVRDAWVYCSHKKEKIT
tara:strand:+ start:1520 stop:1723 length:204 start_codon:yes stop_codon:yes gene_type:complete